MNFLEARRVVVAAHPQNRSACNAESAKTVQDGPIKPRRFRDFGIGVKGIVVAR